MKRGDWCRWDGADLVIQVRARPHSTSDGFDGRSAEWLRVRLTAAPADGKANQRLVRFLAAEFRVPRSHVIIERGETSREKRVRVRRPVRLPAPFAGLGRSPVG